MKPVRRRFSSHEYEQRQSKIRSAMAARGIELLIVTDPANMCWLTGFDGWSFYVHQCVVVSTTGELFWFGRGIDAPTAIITTDLGEQNIFTYQDHYVQSPEHHPMEILAQLLKQKNLHGLKTGVEKDNYYFSAKAMETLQHTLPDAGFIDCTNLVNWQRAVKSSTEIQYMRRAGKVIEQVYERIVHTAHPGMKKNQLVAEILHAGILGTEDCFGDYTAIVPLIGSGDEACACHLTWDGSAIEAGSGTFLELAGAHARYHCPCSRTIYFGKAPAKYLQLAEVINEGIAVTLETMRPGNTCGDVARKFYTLLSRHGYQKDNRCGYSIGLAYPPDWGEHTMSLRESDTTVLEPGMCFHFMPGMWFSDWGFEMTESILVTETGGQCLADVPRKLLMAE